MAGQSQERIDTQVDALEVLDGLLERLRSFLANQVSCNTHWDTRIAQVDGMVEKLFSDPSLLQIAGSHVDVVVAALRGYPVTPPEIGKQLLQIRTAIDAELASFEFVKDWYNPQEFSEVLDRWLKRTEGKYFKYRTQVRCIVDKLSKETERKVLRLKKLAKCAIPMTPREETD